MGSPGRKQFLLRLSHDLFERTKSYADRENCSITQYINRAIEAYVEATDEVDEYAVKRRVVIVDEFDGEGGGGPPPRPNAKVYQSARGWWM